MYIVEMLLFPFTVSFQSLLMVRIWRVITYQIVMFNSFRLSESHYLNQYWFLINHAMWHSSENNFTVNPQTIIVWNEFKSYTFKISPTTPRDQWIICSCDISSSYPWNFFIKAITNVCTCNDMSPAQCQLDKCRLCLYINICVCKYDMASLNDVLHHKNIVFCKEHFHTTPAAVIDHCINEWTFQCLASWKPAQEDSFSEID